MSAVCLSSQIKFIDLRVQNHSLPPEDSQYVEYSTSIQSSLSVFVRLKMNI